MIDGNTNGRIVSDRSVRRPGNSKRASTYAPGSPSATLATVDSTAWYAVNPTSPRLTPGCTTVIAGSHPLHPTRTSVACAHAATSPGTDSGCANTPWAAPM
ncbi:hypothetical protein HASA104033_07515 [Halobacterium salinarum]